ncbi:MAG: hypothetical protein DMG03_10145 [Acidobacteria bacterium]|nr:MAG: hypothetical protein DMG03_10145 [Acidobacteriota bacterium]
MVTLFAMTVFTSAALLFIVEPMIAKMMLPLLGGSPAVWNTCMVFYQLVLLAAYVYAHMLSRIFTKRRQVIIHTALVGLSIAALPVILPSGMTPPADRSPIPWLLLVLARTAAVPLFVVSSTSPLLQRWIASGGRTNPYALYAASNAGSMLALVAYPALLEPFLTLHQQSATWTTAYVGFGLLSLACAAWAWLSWGFGKGQLYPVDETAVAEAPPPTATLVRWIVLAAVPSSLMLGVTTFLTTDIAAIPLLWILPLGLYLLTLVLVFMERSILPHALMDRLLPILVVPIVSLIIFDSRMPPALQIVLHVATFFVATMVCHGELARNKPQPAYLTTFYVCLATGGSLGGLFNAVIAPVAFKTVLEYPLAVVIACLFRPAASSSVSRWTRFMDLLLPVLLGAGAAAMMFAFHGADSKTVAGVLMVFVAPGVVLFGFRRRPLRFAAAVAALMIASSTFMSANEHVVFRSRSFFSVHRVTVDSKIGQRRFVHGGIVHGMQSTNPALRREPTAYFHRSGPAGQIFASVQRKPQLRVGIVGLGIGTLAAYSRAGEDWTFFEIDPGVVEIARDPHYFTYLSDSPAHVDVVLGDARLKLADTSDRRFDLLVLDAFSSDAIPMHLLTGEALDLYARKLSETGVLMFHISSRYVELKQVLADAGMTHGLVCFERDDLKLTEGDIANGKFASRWLVMVRGGEQMKELANDTRWEHVLPRAGRPIWTDDFSNLLSVFKWRG